MPPVRLLKRQRRRRVNNASAASAIQANASTESLPLTLPYPHRTVLATPSVSTSADRSFSADDRDHVASVGGRRRLVSTAFPSVPPAALDKVESFTYARAVSAAAHSTGGMNGGKPDSSYAPSLVVHSKYRSSSPRYPGGSKSVAHDIKSDSPCLFTLRCPT